MRPVSQRELHWLVLILLSCGAATAAAQNRPSSFDEFEVVGFINDPTLSTTQTLELDPATINKLNCGCAAGCGPGSCTTPEDTYLYFPSYENSGGNPKPYYIPAGQIQIDRQTSLFVAGSDIQDAVFILQNPDLDATVPAAPMFTVVSAPLVNFANMKIRPDPGYRQANLYPDGPVAIHFANMNSVDAELLNLRIYGSKIKFEGPGDFRLQNVSAQLLGSVDTFLDIDHPDADVTVVGGLFGDAGPYHGPGLAEFEAITTCFATSLGNLCTSPPTAVQSSGGIRDERSADFRIGGLAS